MSNDKQLTAEEIRIISEVLNIHPDPITPDSIHECTSLEIAKCIRMENARLREANEKLIKNIKLIAEIISTETHENNINNPYARFQE